MDFTNYFLFLIGVGILLLVVYITVQRVSNGDRPQDKAKVTLPLTAKDLKNKENYLAKNSANAYIQNNTQSIAARIAVLTPSFNKMKFIEFAKSVFSKLVKEKNTAAIDNVVAADIDISQLPAKISRYENCFLHNFIIKEDVEQLKVLFDIDDGETPDIKRYFAYFTRKNSLKNTTRGGVIAVSCPHCGAALGFEHRSIKTCPYCGKPVTYAEYDWKLTAVEHIVEGTVIDNRAVLEEKNGY